MDKMILKKILYYGLAFLLGALVAAFMLFSQMGTSMKNQMQIMKDFSLAYEVGEASRTYLGDNIDGVKIYSLNHAINYLEKACRENKEAACEQAAYYDLAILYVRLGQMYDKAGKKEIATQNFNKGFALVGEKRIFDKRKGTKDEIKTPVDLRAYVDENDKKLRTPH